MEVPTMIIKASAALRNDYTLILNMAKREQMLQLRAKVLQAEQKRMDGVEVLSISRARQQLRERINP